MCSCSTLCRCYLDGLGDGLSLGFSVGYKRGYRKGYVHGYADAVVGYEPPVALLPDITKEIERITQVSRLSLPEPSFPEIGRLKCGCWAGCCTCEKPSRMFARLKTKPWDSSSDEE